MEVEVDSTKQGWTVVVTNRVVDVTGSAVDVVVEWGVAPMQPHTETNRTNHLSMFDYLCFAGSLHITWLPSNDTATKILTVDDKI